MSIGTRPSLQAAAIMADRGMLHRRPGMSRGTASGKAATNNECRSSFAEVADAP